MSKKNISYEKLGSELKGVIIYWFNVQIPWYRNWMSLLY